jgi:ribosomal protein L37AE/L43A|tara:strand:- start:4478 stop:4663 length:186 start_codon:yes stop_codon:yes gene_type:complete
METYIEKQDEKLWVCTECGKTTAGYDGDYLISHNLHLSCHLKEEIKKEQSVKNNKRRERNN